MFDKFSGLCRMYGAEAVWLAVVRCYFGKKLIVGDTGRSDQIQLFPDFSLDSFGYIDSKRDVLLVLRYVQKGFVQRKRFDDIRIFMEYLMYLPGYGFVDIHPSGHKRELRT